jgi:hypothetical protein
LLLGCFYSREYLSLIVFKMIIRHADLASCLQAVTGLNLTLGQGCRILFPSYDLEIFPSAIFKLLNQPTVEAVEPAPLPPTYVDREVLPNLAQKAHYDELTELFISNYQDAPTDEQRRQAFLDYRRSVTDLRLHIIQPIAEQDIDDQTALIYGGLHIPGCVSIDRPDGRHYIVDLLVHYSHPVSPEELRLRERRVTCKKILRYYVPGLDDARWQQQNQQRQSLDADGWRTLIAHRLEFKYGLLRPHQETVTMHRKIV